MGVTLTPVVCLCGRIPAYHIRAGIAHRNAERRDRYNTCGAVTLVDGRWIIGPLVARKVLPPGFEEDMRSALRAVNIDQTTWEHHGKVVEEKV